MRTKIGTYIESGEAVPAVLFFLAVAFLIGLVLLVKSHDVRHRATVILTKKHRIVMRDDRGKWYEYVLNDSDLFMDITRNAKGELTIPRGGSWRAGKSLSEEEDEAVTEEETTIDETPEGAPDGAGDVGGDDGGTDGGSDSGGDGGGDGGDGL